MLNPGLNRCCPIAMDRGLEVESHHSLNCQRLMHQDEPGPRARPGAFDGNDAAATVNARDASMQVSIVAVKISVMPDLRFNEARFRFRAAGRAAKRPHIEIDDDLKFFITIQ